MNLRARFEDDVSRAEQTAKETRHPVGDDVVSPAARNLALAHHLAHRIDRGEIADYTQAARILGVSQPRLTHLMSMLLLAPSIQEAILVGDMRLGDKALRQLARIGEWSEQAMRTGVPQGR